MAIQMDCIEAIRKLGAFTVDLLSRNAVVEYGLAMTGQPSEHQVDVADLDHCGTRFGPPFIVFAVTPTTSIPGVGTLHNPASRSMPRVALLREYLFAALANVWDVMPLLHYFLRRLSSVALIRAQMLLNVLGAAHNHRGQCRVQKFHIVPVRSAYDKGQRDSTGVYKEAALGSFFFPGLSGLVQRLAGPAVLSPSCRLCFAKPTQCPPTRRIPPNRAATSSQTRQVASILGSTGARNSRFRIPWVMPSIGNRYEERTQSPQICVEAPRVSGHHRVVSCTCVPSRVCVSESAAPPAPTRHSRRSMT